MIFDLQRELNKTEKIVQKHNMIHLQCILWNNNNNSNNEKPVNFRKENEVDPN